MWETSARLLQLLSLLQKRHEWGAGELGRELSITTRTVRRDVVRLRDLGYPIVATYGVGGGYQLERGATIPPLMFDTEEAATTILALRAKASNAPDGELDSTLSALEKLTRVMPVPVHAAISAMSEYSTQLDIGGIVGGHDDAIDLKSLIVLARACRERQQVDCTYRSNSGETKDLVLEPLRLVKALGHWYLAAFSPERGRWSVFRVDRISRLRLLGRPSYPRRPPADDMNAYVLERVSAGMRQVTVSIRVLAPRARVERWVTPIWGSIITETPQSCIINAGADSYDSVARWMLLFDAELEVISPPELRDSFIRLAQRCSRAGAALPSR
jgi:predicted DNA-binding transcriptional regulator YafY